MKIINFGDLVRSLKRIAVKDNGQELNFDKYVLVYNNIDNSLELIGVNLNEEGVSINQTDIKSVDENDVVEIHIEN